MRRNAIQEAAVLGQGVQPWEAEEICAEADSEGLLVAVGAACTYTVGRRSGVVTSSRS